MQSPSDLVLANDDLVSEILLRLPTKSVLEFKLVSKKWLCIISNPEFATQHTRMTARRGFISGLLFGYSTFRQSPMHYKYLSLLDHEDRFFPCSLRILPLDTNKDTVIEQSCNGLLLCSTFEPNGAMVTKAKTKLYYVVNPTTRRFSLIPPAPPTFTGQKWQYHHVYLVFDPSISSHYQVLNVHRAEAKLRVHLYSSRIKNWKPCVEGNDPDLTKVGFWNGTYWNGSFIWVNRVGDGFRFPLDQECLIKVPKSPIEDMRNYLFFGECGGDLHLITLDPRDDSHNLVVFFMEKDWSTWNLKYRVTLDTILLACRVETDDHWNHIDYTSCAARKATPDMVDVIYRRLRIQRFISLDYMNLSDEFVWITSAHIQSGKIQSLEYVSHGI